MNLKRILPFTIILACLFVNASAIARTKKTPPSRPAIKQQGQSGRDLKPGEPGYRSPGRSASQQASNNCGNRCSSSPINPTPPECSDSRFVVDCGSGLDTGCTFRSGGPLVFSIKITRYVGDDIPDLKANGLIADMATLDMPAFDVDVRGGGQGINPERDRVWINDHIVPGEFLSGDNNVWKLNSFVIPVEWLHFATMQNGTLVPGENEIRIDIDTANTDEAWCTAIDWAAITIEAARPVLFVHGIFSSGDTWKQPLFSWVNQLRDLGGLPNETIDLGFFPQTIQANAFVIAAKVAELRQRWGVDKINLVCHSKGGLDARHVVENSKSVEQVIQIGTPNAGSPLADAIIIASLALDLLIPKSQLILNLVGLGAAPGGYQLTTPYMSLYNFTHGHNDKVRYTALAGSYDPGCTTFLCRVGDGFLTALMGGPSDQVVPVSSVYSLSYTENLAPFETVGGDVDSRHTHLTSSRRIYDLLASRIKRFGVSTNAIAPSITPAFTPTAAKVGTIHQGQTQTQTLVIDQATPASFLLMYPSGNLDMALISPSGQRFDPGTIAGNPNIGREDLEILGGRIEVYSFSNAEVGTWTTEIKAPSVVEPSGEVAYAVIGYIENPAIKFTASASRLNIHSGESLRLVGTLKNGASPILGASVSAHIRKPGNTSQDINLHDDGANGDATANDGIYTGDFPNTSLPGSYRILFTASRGAVSGVPAFSRQDHLLATVSSSNSSFLGFHDSGLDTDGDNFFNKLVVRADLNITHAAGYRIMGTLTDTSGNTHQATANAQLGSGVQNVSLEFDGEEFFRNRVDGPYQLSSILLVEENGEDIMPVDSLTNAFQTAAYSFRAFQHGPLSLTGTGSAVGIDTNGNALFDLLSVGIDVEVVNAGSYEWSATLVDRTGKEIGFATNTGSLIAGLNRIALEYNGERIGNNGIDGPYFVKSLLVFGSGQSLVAQNAFTTGPFLASQFEGSFDICIKDDNSNRYLQVSSVSGKYIYRDCSKGITLTGTGKVTRSFCKITLTDAGPVPKHPDRSVSINVNTCTHKADAAIKVTMTAPQVNISDVDIRNSGCGCQ
ncbi:MAG: choice-of-anchor X domain-containing protein [Blastocatellia bacterium]